MNMKSYIVRLNVYFLLGLFSFIQLQSMDIGYGRLVVDCVGCLCKASYSYCSDNVSSYKYSDVSTDSNDHKKLFFLNFLNYSQLPLMQLAIGGITAVACSSQKQLVPMPIMFYAGVYALYKQMQNIDAYLEKKITTKNNRLDNASAKMSGPEVKEKMKQLVSHLIANAMFFYLATEICAFSQRQFSALFEQVVPVGIGSAMLSHTWIGNGLDIATATTLPFLQARELVLITAILIAACRLKPKNGNYFYVNSMWLYIPLDVLRISFYLNAPYGKECMGENNGENTPKENRETLEKISLVGYYTLSAVPVVLTLGHTLLHR